MKLNNRDIEEIKSIAHYYFTNMTVERFEPNLLAKSYILAIQTFCARKNINIKNIEFDQPLTID